MCVCVCSNALYSQTPSIQFCNLSSFLCPLPSLQFRALTALTKEWGPPASDPFHGHPFCQIVQVELLRAPLSWVSLYFPSSILVRDLLHLHTDSPFYPSFCPLCTGHVKQIPTTKTLGYSSCQSQADKHLKWPKLSRIKILFHFIPIWKGKDYIPAFHIRHFIA